jgi:acetyl-CoA synthetase (ADP-forming)
VKIDALADIIMRVSQLAAEHPQIQEMDVNPVMAYDDGALAVDCRVRIGPASS